LESGFNEYIFLIMTLGTFCIILMVLAIVLLLFRMRKKTDRSDRTQVGFVVDTFQELVYQLKGKEKELDVLRKKAEDRAGTMEGELRDLESQARLRQDLANLGEMAAGIAHELRNPMGVIAGYMNILMQKTDENLKPTVEAVSKEVAAMDRIINDFLSFARPGKPNLAEVDLRRLMEECARTIKGNYEIDISVDASNAPAALADEVLLKQAVLNLLQNATEAVREGGEISLSCRLEGDMVDITVSDSGHGIPETLKNRVFLPFFTTRDRGTGLGLAIVHRIVTGHGGTVDVNSSGSGTVFRIMLPLKAALP
jgi:signal transduction histidine kinase